MKPPLLPSEVLRRVLRVARFDGVSVLGIASACAVVSAASHDPTGTIVGVLAAAAGAMELAGAGMLGSGDPRGLRWLVTSQLFLLVTVLGYVALRLSNIDVEPLRKAVTPEIAEQIQQAGMTTDAFLVEMMRLVYIAVAGATILYQGGMAVYYLRKSAGVLMALNEDEA